MIVPQIKEHRMQDEMEHKMEAFFFFFSYRGFQMAHLANLRRSHMAPLAANNMGAWRLLRATEEDRKHARK